MNKDWTFKLNEQDKTVVVGEAVEEESETDNDGQRSGVRYDDHHHSFPDVERLAGNMAFICIAGFVQCV